jgi:hypothetical protein
MLVFLTIRVIKPWLIVESNHHDSQTNQTPTDTAVSYTATVSLIVQKNTETQAVWDDLAMNLKRCLVGSE